MNAPNPGVRFPPPLLFVVALGLGVACHKWFPLSLAPPRLRPVGVLGGWSLVAIWVVFMGWAMLTFVRQRTSIVPSRPANALVTWGPYRLSRNPMYVALSVGYVGASMLVNALWPVLFLPAVWALLYLLVIRREERYLAAAFGDEYESYRARVRRWL